MGRSNNALDSWLDALLHEPATPVAPDMLPLVDRDVRAWLFEPRTSMQLLGLAEYASGFGAGLEQLVGDLLWAAWELRPTLGEATDWSDEWWRDAVMSYLPGGPLRSRLLERATDPAAS